MIVVTQLPFVATLVISFFDWNALYPDARQLHRLRQLRRRPERPGPAQVGVDDDPAHRGGGPGQPGPRPGPRPAPRPRFKGRGVVRTLLIAPFLVVPVAAALLWKHVLYNPEYGLLNGLLHYVGRAPTGLDLEHPAARGRGLTGVAVDAVHDAHPAGRTAEPRPAADRGRPGGRRERLADLRPPHPPPTCAATWNSAPCSARSTSSRTSTRSSRSRSGGLGTANLPYTVYRASTRPTRTASRRPRASWSSSARSSSPPSRCAWCRPCSARRSAAHDRHRRTPPSSPTPSRPYAPAAGPVPDSAWWPGWSASSSSCPSPGWR